MNGEETIGILKQIVSVQDCFVVAISGDTEENVMLLNAGAIAICEKQNLLNILGYSQRAMSTKHLRSNKALEPTSGPLVIRTTGRRC